MRVDRPRREVGEIRRYPLWMLLSICALVCAAAFIVIRTVQGSIYMQSEISKQPVKETGCAIYDVDPEINPCDNFYKFACNKWQQQNPRPAWSPEWSVDAIVDDKITKNVVAILEQPDKDDDLKVITQSKDMYQKCLINNGDYNSDYYVIQNTWKSLGGLYSKGLRTGHPAPSRRLICGALVYKHFQFALLHKSLEVNYKDKRELEKIIVKVQTMFRNIKSAFEIEKSQSFIKWDEDTKMCAGYPPWIFNPSRVQAGYDWVTLNKNQTFREQMAYVASSNWDLFDDNFQDYECHMWYLKGENTRPKSYNELYLPMRLLMSPFFDLKRPGAINYGSLGTAIADIMAPSKIDWEFNEATSCIEKQYSSFTLDIGDEQISVNGRKTLRDNFAHNVALQEAYAAFSRTNRYANGKIDHIPAATCKSKSPNQFTNDQLFFLGYAQSWCQSLAKEEVKLSMQNRSQSPSLFKVIGALQNFKGFAQAWNCPVGSIMNPIEGEKCQVL